MTTTSPVPGWYADPAGAPGVLRYWDGSAWTAQTQNAPAAAANPYGAPAATPVPFGGPQQAPTNGCQICGASPAAVVQRKRQHGMIYLRRSWSQRILVCRTCGTGEVRAWQNETLLAGWWGVISFFFNFGAVATNASSLRTLAAMPAPQGMVRPQRSAGSSLFKRPGVYVPVVVLVVVVVLLASSGSGGSSS